LDRPSILCFEHLSQLFDCDRSRPRRYKASGGLQAGDGFLAKLVRLDLPHGLHRRDSSGYLLVPEVQYEHNLADCGLLANIGLLDSIKRLIRR
jgi:hypothetical protein